MEIKASHTPHSTQSRNRFPVLILLFTLLLNAFLLWHFHDHSWAPHDDGYFAHVAERLVHGEVLNRDIQSRHAGYIHFVNAGTFSLFGSKVVALRYPLLALSLAQSALIFLIFLPQSLGLALLASFAINSLGYLQSLTPATHWYCLFLTLTAIFWLTQVPREKPYRILVLGIFLGGILLFRQLTGVFTAIGFFAYLLIENREAEKAANSLLGQMLLLASAGLLIFYLSSHHDVLGFFLFLFWPFFLLVWAFLRINISNKTVFKLLILLSAGLLIASLPLLVYHSWHGSWAAWFEDLRRSAQLLSIMPYEQWSNFSYYLTLGVSQFLLFKDPASTLNGLYWTLLPVLPFLNGLFLALTIWKKKGLSREEFFSFIAVFYGLVSHTLQIPIYLYYSAGLSLIALLGILRKPFILFYKLGCLLTLALIGTTLYFHAGQPSQRGFAGLTAGTRVVLSLPNHLAKAGIRMLPEEIETFQSINAALERITQPGDSIFVFPNDPEIYFLSGRRNPFRFDFLPAALQSEKDKEEILKEIRIQKPKVVIHHRQDKYNNALSEALRDNLQEDYKLAETVEEFDLYVYKRPL